MAFRNPLITELITNDPATGNRITIRSGQINFLVGGNSSNIFGIANGIFFESQFSPSPSLGRSSVVLVNSNLSIVYEGITPTVLTCSIVLSTNQIVFNTSNSGSFLFQAGNSLGAFIIRSNNFHYEDRLTSFQTTLDMNGTGLNLQTSGSFGILLSCVGGTSGAQLRNTLGPVILDASLDAVIIARAGLVDCATSVATRSVNVARSLFMPMHASAFTVASGSKYKRGISRPKPLTLLDKAEGLRPARWTDKGTSVVRHGMIAEDVLAVFPELVVTDDTGFIGIDVSASANLALALVGDLHRRLKLLEGN
jgi:hypothetical protein